MTKKFSDGTEIPNPKGLPTGELGINIVDIGDRVWIVATITMDESNKTETMPVAVINKALWSDPMFQMETKASIESWMTRESARSGGEVVFDRKKEALN